VAAGLSSGAGGVGRPSDGAVDDLRPIGEGIGQTLVLAAVLHHTQRVVDGEPASFESILVVGVGLRLGGLRSCAKYEQQPGGIHVHVQAREASDLDRAATFLQRFAPPGFDEVLAWLDAATGQLPSRFRRSDKQDTTTRIGDNQTDAKSMHCGIHRLARDERDRGWRRCTYRVAS
jgi:hypothetical protein